MSMDDIEQLLQESSDEIIEISTGRPDDDLPEWREDLPDVIPVMPLRGVVLFPGTVAPLTVAPNGAASRPRHAEKFRGRNTSTGWRLQSGSARKCPPDDASGFGYGFGFDPNRGARQVYRIY